MVAKCIFGACLAFICAAPVLGEEGNGTRNIQLAKFVENTQSLQKESEPPPKVKIRENFDYYEIDGKTSDELRAQMKQHGTAWNDGKVYAALTTWDIRYHYDIDSAGGRYALSAVSTDVDIVFHLPKLITSAKTPEQLVSSWDSYFRNLKTHEFGHRDIAVAICREICQALNSLGSSSSKSELDHEAQDLIKAKFQKLRETQIQYDLETRHGKNQGAVLRDPFVAATVPPS